MVVSSVVAIVSCHTWRSREQPCPESWAEFLTDPWDSTASFWAGAWELWTELAEPFSVNILLVSPLPARKETYR